MDDSHEIFDQLIQHCQIGDLESFISELNIKESILKIQDATGKTVLHYCAEQADIRFAKEIVGRNPELVNNKDIDGFTALHLGVIAGNSDFVQLVLGCDADLESQDNELHTAVHWAIVCGDLEILKSLIKHGALVSIPDIHGAHPLHYAAQVSNNRSSLELLRYLIKNKADVNAIDNDGRSPVLWAASSGCKEALLEIYNAGATITSSDKDGLTALHCAASRGFTDCVEALIGLCGVFVDPPDNQETTPLFYAVSLGHSECTEALLRFGADPNYRDLKGRTPGHFASFRGRLECLRLLHFYGADLWAPSERGDTPFLEAVSGGKYDVIEWLLDGRPEGIRSSNSEGRSCLHIAALYNNLDIARLLLERDADINAVMRGSEISIFLTPLDVALKKGHIALAKFFQEYGGVPATKVTDSRAVAR
ncbi:serine/threonine-protein phosphatase 6 regulatory ankyrin repeat subunit A-like [Artemia franciscana]|uniref:serine/threonine-protein phosphatase 6 regulatory ankyrin repeat subunit A-like n=1 Tax=Artemia franciscana TaxID=6661 RepID=UPI0032D9B9AE